MPTGASASQWLHAIGLGLATLAAIVMLGPMSYIAIMSPMVLHATNGLHAIAIIFTIGLFTLSLIVCPVGAWIAFIRTGAARAWRWMAVCAGCGGTFLLLWLLINPTGKVG